MYVEPAANAAPHPNHRSVHVAPRGQAGVFRKALAEARAGEVRTVAAGDTLSELVADQLRASGRPVSGDAIYAGVAAVAMANGIADPDFILPGQRIDFAALENMAVGAPATPPAQSGNAHAHNNGGGGLLDGPARISSRFGYRADPIHGKRRHHNGVDIAAREGTPIRPLLPGKVVRAGWQQGYGNAVVVQHANGMETLYGHISKNLVRVGETLTADTVLGLVGSTGRATGPHLHIEVRRDGERIDPMPLLRQQGAI